MTKQNLAAGCATRERSDDDGLAGRELHGDDHAEGEMQTQIPSAFSSYFLNYYVDVNEDGVCSGNEDGSWRISLTNVQSDYALHVKDGDQMSNLGCSGLNDMTRKKLSRWPRDGVYALPVTSST